MMARVKVTQKRLDEFLAALEKVGGTSGNSSLRTELGWNEELYWKVQGRLIRDGKIVVGRGRGGSVRFTEGQATELGTEEPAPPEPAVVAQRERDIYPALKQAIEQKWIKRFGLDEALVDATHSRGSKDTGGTFTRPDITAVGIRQFVYLPKRLEIVTFEAKIAEATNIMGVLEAIAHREAAHRSYVLYSLSRDRFDNSNEAERIVELAQKFGVGVVLTEQPSNVETWEVVVDAVRHEPDPTRLDRFLADLPSDDMKTKLAKWRS